MKKYLQTLVLFLVTLFICNENLFAQDGTLDSTFGDNGIILKTKSAGDNTSIILEDGKILVLSGSHILSRFHPNGSVDKSFGNNGVVYFNFGKKFYSADNKFALQKDGKIVCLGKYAVDGIDACVGRLNADGTIDTSFGIRGIAKCHLFYLSYAIGLVIQDDGKIVIAGYTTWIDYITQRSFIIRFLPDGSLDKTFGRGGILINKYNQQTYIAGLVIRPDGHLILGSTYDVLEEHPSYIVQSFNTDGSVDETFGKAGKASYVFGSGMPRYWYTQLDNMTIQPDGKIVCLGTSGTGGWYMALCRFNSNGTIDSSFGNNGSVVDPNYTQGELYVSTLDLQQDGKIITLSTNYRSKRGKILLTRYLPNGIIDSTFGENGYSITGDKTLSYGGYSIHYLDDGKIFVSGLYYPGFDQYNYLFLARFNGDNTNKSNEINTFSAPTKIENTNKELVSLYPNPAKNIIMIKGLDKNATALIKIIDIQGREMINQNISQIENASINISKLATGNYFVQIVQNGKITRLKFIKE